MFWLQPVSVSDRTSKFFYVLIDRDYCDVLNQHRSNSKWSDQIWFGQAGSVASANTKWHSRLRSESNAHCAGQILGGLTTMFLDMTHLPKGAGAFLCFDVMPLREFDQTFCMLCGRRSHESFNAVQIFDSTLILLICKDQISARLSLQWRSFFQVQSLLNERQMWLSEFPNHTHDHNTHD